MINTHEQGMARCEFAIGKRLPPDARVVEQGLAQRAAAQTGDAIPGASQAFAGQDAMRKHDYLVIASQGDIAHIGILST